MAYRLISSHRAFFSPHYVSGSASKLTTTAVRRLMFDVETQEEFEEKVLNSKKPVVVDFHATWCQPCKALTPILKAVIENAGENVDCAKVDIDVLTDIAMEYGVVSVPTVAGFKSGKKLDTFVGLVEQKQVEEFVNKLIES